MATFVCRGPISLTKALRRAKAVKPSPTLNARAKSRINPFKVDPTRTAMLRQWFVNDAKRRFNALKAKLYQLIVEDDSFGLSPRRLISDVGRQLLGNDGASLATNERWQFLTDAQKLDEFQKWLAIEMENTIAPRNMPADAWWHKYIEEGYSKGAGRAFDDARATTSKEASVSDFFTGSRSEFLRGSVGPESVDKIKLLAGRVFTDLKGITDEVSKQLTRELTDGLIRGIGIRQIAKNISKRIDTIGKYRATVLARTEVIRAHGEGQLDALERLGVTEIGVMVEWSTAGDTRVCPLCEPLSGVVLTIKEARGILPRHPQCRCTYIPANVGEGKKGQSRTKSAIDKAIERSIRREIPARLERTLAEQRELSKWTGADLDPNKVRPVGILDRIKPAKDGLSRVGTLPDGRAVYGNEGLNFTRRKVSATDRESSVVLVDITKLDKAWSKAKDNYIPRGGGGNEIGGRRLGFRDFLEKGGGTLNNPIEMSRVYLDDLGRVNFSDGRHRFTVLRDDEYKRVPVLVSRAQAAKFRRLFGSKRKSK